MDCHVRIPVWRYFNVVCRREGRDLPSFRNAARERRVALQYVDGIGGDQIARPPTRELVLTRGDGMFCLRLTSAQPAKSSGSTGSSN